MNVDIYVKRFFIIATAVKQFVFFSIHKRVYFCLLKVCFLTMNDKQRAIQRGTTSI